ncbi:MAG: hypothetical protein AAF909_07135, partial [Pseudomonadota bacterium]
APAATGQPTVVSDAADRRMVTNTLNVFDAACLTHRRDIVKSRARLQEIGFQTVNGAEGPRLVLDNMVADAQVGPNGDARCFAATPVLEVEAFISGLDTLMRERFADKVTRGAVNGSPAWRAAPEGEEAFIVAVRAARQSPEQPVIAIATLIAPQG